MHESFQPTRNTLLDKACDSREDVRRQAVNELIEVYRAPLAAFLKVNGWRYGVREDEADDILQSFVLDKFLERSIFARFERREGIRFRSFLLRVFVNYIRNLLSPANPSVDLPDQAAAEDTDPSRHYDICWARRVVRETLVLMQTECSASDRPDLWVVFAERLARPILEGTPPTPYKELATRFRLSTTDQVHSLLTTAKRKYERALRSVVSQYACGRAAVEEEIRELMKILAEANGQAGGPDAAGNAGEDKS